VIFSQIVSIDIFGWGGGGGRTTITPVNLEFDWFDLDENGYFNLYS
jgi:hypothetical protein